MGWDRDPGSGYGGSGRVRFVPLFLGVDGILRFLGGRHRKTEAPKPIGAPSRPFYQKHGKKAVGRQKGDPKAANPGGNAWQRAKKDKTLGF